MDRKKILFIGISILVCLLVYLPTPKGIDPEQYSPATPPSLEHIQVSQDKLKNAAIIVTPAEGAQDVEIDKEGFIYSGLHDGTIIKINPQNSHIQVVAKSQGPIFGLDINKQGNKLAIADQLMGIKILDLQSRQFQYVASQYNGVKFASPNAVVFGPNDHQLFFTVSSQKIPMSDFHEMLLYSQGSGRIFSYDLKKKQIQVLSDNLHFVNGIEYSAKDNCLYFIQTSRSRLSRLQLSSEKRGNISIILENILGYPDNVKLTESGDLWIAIPAMRDSFSNIIDHNSIIRRVILNLRMPLSMFMTLANMKYAGGIKVNPKTKEIVEYFFGNSDNINCISGINEKQGKVYLSSLSQNKIAIVNLQKNANKEVEKVIQNKQVDGKPQVVINNVEQNKQEKLLTDKKEERVESVEQKQAQMESKGQQRTVIEEKNPIERQQSINQKSKVQQNHEPQNVEINIQQQTSRSQEPKKVVTPETNRQKSKQQVKVIPKAQKKPQSNSNTGKPNSQGTLNKKWKAQPEAAAKKGRTVPTSSTYRKSPTNGRQEQGQVFSGGKNYGRGKGNYQSNQQL